MFINLIVHALDNNERILVSIESNYAIRNYASGLKSLTKHVEQSLSHVYLLQRKTLRTLNLIEVQEEDSVPKM